MDVGLFDLHTQGHHLPYADRLKQAIEIDSEYDVTFITLSRTKRCAERFDSDEIVYLDDPESPAIEERDRSFRCIAEKSVSDFLSDKYISEYDVVHFLYADTILGPLWRHCSSNNSLQLIAELNGTFFHRGTVLRRKYVHQLFLRLLQSNTRKIIDSLVPERTSHEALWEDVYLYRCLRDNSFDHVVVHSQEAKAYLSRLAPAPADSVHNLPYPAPNNLGTGISRSQARKQLNLPPEVQILLFFGSMRTEKGINFFLETLRRYQGSPFTVVLAGPAVSFSENYIKKCGNESSVNVVYNLKFIDQPELYYRAADAVILPYLRKYGRERTSQMFQEVCSSLRPVIVPDFGALGRLTEEWQLGVTYRQGSHESLAKKLSMFAADEIPFSQQRMQAYTDQHSDNRVADKLRRMYIDA